MNLHLLQLFFVSFSFKKKKNHFQQRKFDYEYVSLIKFSTVFKFLFSIFVILFLMWNRIMCCLCTQQSNFTPFQFHAELLMSSFLRYSIVYFSFLSYYFWFPWLSSASGDNRSQNGFVEKNLAQKFCRLLKKLIHKIRALNNPLKWLSFLSYILLETPVALMFIFEKYDNKKVLFALRK